MDNAVVTFLQATSLDVVSILQCYLLGRECLMSASTVHIELSWLIGILAGYFNILGTTTYIESLLETKCIFLAIYSNSTFTTDIDDTQLTVIEQVLLIVWLICIKRSDRSQLQRSCCRLSTTNQETVKHRVSPVYLTWSKNLLDGILTTKTVCCVMLCIHWVACITNIVISVGIFSLHLISALAALCKTSTSNEQHCK